MRAVKVTSAEGPAEGTAGGRASAAAVRRPVVAAPDPEVAERALRRTFTAEFKRQVLAEADACTDTGEIGALLRRHGLYSSHLVTWRRQREEGTLAGLAPRKRGRKPQPTNPLAGTVAQLERENRQLRFRAERAEALVELQKNCRGRPSRHLLDEKLREGRAVAARPHVRAASRRSPASPRGGSLVSREQWPSTFWCSANP